MTAICCRMNLIETYSIRVYGPDADMTTDQEDALNSDRERFDAALRALVVEAVKDSGLSITICAA